MTRSQTMLVLVALIGMLAAGTPALAANGTVTDGYLYGKVTTRTGNTYTGLLRWGKEEAFWDDLFNSSKEELPYSDRAADTDDDESIWQRLRVFGKRINVHINTSSRMFISRFGDIKRIEVLGDDEAVITMRSGTSYEVSGGANDVEDDITIRDPSLGVISVPWEKIKTIELMATPAHVKPEGQRLRGTVTTESGVFEGYIQWDKQECLTSDELDGDAEDGRLSIAMGKIASIERRSRSSANVTLRDGRTLVLDGTNDVNSSNRGIYIEDERYGRVEVSWDSFERLELAVDGSSGRGYNDFPVVGQLRGTVTDSRGKRHTGAIIFDLDESEGWEMLNGDQLDNKLSIPFANIAVIERRDHDSSTITLRNGQTLDLEDGQDVSDRNDGVVILGNGTDSETYLSWSEVKRIELQ